MIHIAKLLIKEGAFEINFEKRFRFSSGILSPVYCDNRILLSLPKTRKKIISAMMEKIVHNKLDFSTISGIETASIPWASMLAFKLNKVLIYIRKEEKGHGKGKRIEGRFNKNDKVLLIEDLVSTGKSAISSINALKSEGLIVKYCLVIFSYNINNVNEKFNSCGVNLITLTDIDEILDVGIKERMMTNAQKKEIIGSLEVI
ncbi:MAG: orotate phosphoribosyltransferase [Nanoarchaeota archaeon]